jgi:hypothetical protein
MSWHMVPLGQGTEVSAFNGTLLLRNAASPADHRAACDALRADVAPEVERQFQAHQDTQRAIELAKQVGDIANGMELAKLKIDELEATRRRLAKEAPAGLAAKLVEIDTQLEVHRKNVADLLRQHDAIRDVAADASADAEHIRKQLTLDLNKRLYRELQAQRNKALADVSVAIEKHFTDIGTLTDVLGALEMCGVLRDGGTPVPAHLPGGHAVG